MFETVYQISRFPFPDMLPLDILGIVISFLGTAGCISELVEVFKTKKRGKLAKPLAGTVICGFILLAVLYDFLFCGWSSASMYSKAFYRGEYDVVEGTVENYHFENHFKEFSVNGVEFAVMTQSNSQGFKDRGCHIYGDGEYVRISYYTEYDSPGGRAIVKVEEWKSNE